MSCLLCPFFWRAPLQDGLAQQLLGVVVAHERPDLESSRQDLIREMGANKGLLSKLEDTLLRELSSATGARRRHAHGAGGSDEPLAVHPVAAGPLACK